MKKSIVKYLSTFLVLALILSVLPMSAFAAEGEVSPCAECHHSYTVTHYRVPVANSYSTIGHTVNLIDRYNCIKCGYYYTVNNGTATDPHAIVKTYVGTMVNIDGGTVSVYDCECKSCNYKYTLTE